ncbi:MAG: FAD-dependent oxidoreductase, partial [Pseudomonadota bacterium]|nr:FAD-dependent oxidoreductase [Pseudomonadota bacterium]
NRKAPFSHLIYPLPEAGGLGVHLTLDLAGAARFGPDVEWLAPGDISQPDYRVDSTQVDNFYSAIHRYWPGLEKGDLTADYCGIRPKVVSRTPDNDFMIQTEREHDLPGWVNLLGIESPGLTASLSLADEVCTIIRGQSRT